jgi:hypothetical protein
LRRICLLRGPETSKTHHQALSSHGWKAKARLGLHFTTYYLDGERDAQEEAVEIRSNLRALAEYAEKAAQDDPQKGEANGTSTTNGGATRPTIYNRTAEHGKR